MHLHKSGRHDWTTGPRAQRQAASRPHGACRWAAEGVFPLPRDTKGFATCPLRLIFSYCCVLGICTQIQPCTIRDVLALFSNKRTPDALENTETAKEKAIGIQSQPPLGLRRTTQCLEHLKLLGAVLTAEMPVLTTSVPIQKPAGFLQHLLLMAASTANAPKLRPVIHHPPPGFSARITRIALWFEWRSPPIFPPKVGQFEQAASFGVSQGNFTDLQGNNGKHPEASTATAYCSLPHVKFREHISNR